MKIIQNCILIVALLELISLGNSARILGYIPTASFSHQVVFRPLWRELSLRGHQVTLVTTDPINDPNLTNLTEIDVHSSYEIMNRDVMKIINSGSNVISIITQFTDLTFEIIDHQFQHPAVKNLISDTNQQFDVVLVEYFFPPPSAFAKHFKCPLIGISSMPAFEVINSLIGVPTHPVLYPDILLPFDKTETLLESVISLFYLMTMYFLNVFYVHSRQNKAIEKYFGKGFSSTDELMNNSSLLLVNSNSILDRPRPSMPAVVYIGGIHRVPPKPLPEPLKSILDSASDGFIYFSLGSNVKSKDIPMKTRQVYLDTFAELPYKVLWKFELDNLPNKPDNVIISKWFPQTDILRHPNIKLFITQGGLQSIEEAISEGVPMVAIPYFGDQASNAGKLVRKGFGLSIDYNSVEKNRFKETVMEAMNNPKYKNKVKEISQLAKDQPIAPLDTAVWWIEYVIRHKGAPHLRSPLLDIPWYQYLLLDVICCCILTLIVTLYIFTSILRTVTKILKNVIQKQQKLKSS